MIKSIFLFFEKNIIIKTKNGSLDGLRGFAVLMVFNVHIFALYYKSNYFLKSPILISTVKTIHAGHIGVDLFFLLSGFFIYLTISRNKYSLLSFYKKRYMRLMPLVLFIILICHSSIKSFKILFDNLTLLNIFGGTSALNFVQWSLTYEVYFYLLIGILLIKIPKIFDRYISIVLLIFFLILTRNLIPYPVKITRFIGLFFGVLIGKLQLEGKLNRHSFFKKNSFYPIFTMLSIILLQFLWGNFNDKINHDFFFVSILLFFSIILISILQDNILTKKIFSFYPLRILGTVSYSFYMIHALITIPDSKRLLSHISARVLFLDNASFSFISIHYVIAFLSSLIISLFLFYYLERPYFLKKK